MHFHYSISLLAGRNLLFPLACQTEPDKTPSQFLYTWRFSQLLSVWELLHHFFVHSLFSSNRILFNNFLPWSCYHLKPLHHHIRNAITDQLHFHHTVALPHCSLWWAATVSNSRAITVYDGAQEYKLLLISLSLCCKTWRSCFWPAEGCCWHAGSSGLTQETC